MKAREALRALAEITESQWGLVTTAQARAAGVQHMDLTRLAQSGDLVRIGHGIYRDAGTPADEYEDLRVAWLSIDPTRSAHQRLRDPHPDAIVSGESAAKLHGIGDFRADELEISLPWRRRSRRAGVQFRVREVGPHDTTIVQGLPATSLERTLADLVHDGHDLSHVADAMSDALRQSHLDDDHLAELLGPAARGRGFSQGDGASLLRKIKEMAGASEHPMVGMLSEASPLITQILDTTASAIARDPALARTILRHARLAELPALVQSLVPLRSLDIPESSVKKLMESAAQLAETLERQRTEDAIRHLEVLREQLHPMPPSNLNDEEGRPT